MIEETIFLKDTRMAIRVPIWSPTSKVSELGAELIIFSTSTRCPDDEIGKNSVIACMVPKSRPSRMLDGSKLRAIGSVPFCDGVAPLKWSGEDVSQTCSTGR